MRGYLITKTHINNIVGVKIEAYYECANTGNSYFFKTKTMQLIKLQQEKHTDYLKCQFTGFWSHLTIKERLYSKTKEYTTILGVRFSVTTQYFL
jgi:hypothetical protein